jgi:hypothetical protein
MKSELLLSLFDLLGVALLTEAASHALFRIEERLAAMLLTFRILAPSTS